MENTETIHCYQICYSFFKLPAFFCHLLNKKALFAVRRLALIKPDASPWIQVKCQMMLSKNAVLLYYYFCLLYYQFSWCWPLWCWGNSCFFPLNVRAYLLPCTPQLSDLLVFSSGSHGFVNFPHVWPFWTFKDCGFCLLFCLCGAFIFSSVLRKLKITFHSYPDDTQVYVPVKYKDSYSLHTLTTILSTVCILSNPDPPQCKKPCVQIID